MAFFSVVVMCCCPTTVSKVWGRYFRADTINFSISRLQAKTIWVFSIQGGKTIIAPPPVVEETVAATLVIETKPVKKPVLQEAEVIAPRPRIGSLAALRQKIQNENAYH